MFFLYLFIGSLFFNACFTKHRNYDNFDIESLLLNATRTRRFFECVSDESKCVHEDKEMKHDIIEMVSTSCANCTSTEKGKYKAAMQALRRSMDESQVINMVISKITNMFQQGSDSDKGSRDSDKGSQDSDKGSQDSDKGSQDSD